MFYYYYYYYLFIYLFIYFIFYFLFFKNLCLFSHQDFVFIFLTRYNRSYLSDNNVPDVFLLPDGRPEGGDSDRVGGQSPRGRDL